LPRQRLYRLGFIVIAKKNLPIGARFFVKTTYAAIIIIGTLL
jgi:hypothetical protein